MIIHTVQKGDTLFSIARRYSIPPTKLLCDNSREGDRLTVGEELIVIAPTRTVTVRGGDTLSSIASRFDVKESTLLLNNPALTLQHRLRPGQIISVKQKSGSLGIGAAVGIADKGLKRESLMMALPFLTYLLVDGAILTESGIGMRFDPSYLTDSAAAERKIAMLKIKDTTGGRFLDDKKSYASIIEKMISLSKKYRFRGIAIEAHEAAQKDPEGLSEFLLLLRKKFIGQDLILFSYISCSASSKIEDLTDGVIMMTSDTDIRKTKRELVEYAERDESSKVFVHLTTDAEMTDSSISIPEARALCYRSGLELSTDENTLISSFTYTRYKTGEGEKMEVRFPSLRYTESKYSSIAENGYGGIAFDIGTCEISRLAMFGACFRKADYMLP